MTDPIKRILSSAKFWTALIGLVLTLFASLLAKYGLSVSDATVSQVATTIASVFAILLGAQGLADIGKSAELLRQSAANDNKNVTAELIREFNASSKSAAGGQP